jgi:hypothetical protein
VKTYSVSVPPAIVPPETVTVPVMLVKVAAPINVIPAVHVVMLPTLAVTHALAAAVAMVAAAPVRLVAVPPPDIGTQDIPVIVIM